MKRRWSRGEKWLMVLSCGFCLPALLLGWVYERQNELPPAPLLVEEVPPANNAFDVILKAVAVAPAPVASTYTKSGCNSSLVDVEGSCDAEYQRPKPFTPQYNRAFSLANKVRYLKTSQNALKLWRDSLALPLYIPDIPENVYRSKELSRS